MPAEAFEKFIGGDAKWNAAGGETGFQIPYIVRRAADKDEALVAVLKEAPSFVGSLSRGETSAKELGNGLWEATVDYVPVGSTPQTNESSFSFDTTGGTQHLTQVPPGLTGTAYSASGPAPDFGGAIGVNGGKVEGVDTGLPQFEFSVTRRYPPQNISQAFIGALYRLTYQTNNSQFNIVTDDGAKISFARGECLFKGARGGVNGKGDWEIAFSFAASPNLTGYIFPLVDSNGDTALTPIDKKGWEYFWVLYEDDEDKTAKKLVKKAIAVYVYQVYYEGSFAVLA